MTKRERIEQLEQQVAELTKRVETAEAARVTVAPYPTVVPTGPAPGVGWPTYIPGNPSVVPQTVTTPWTGDPPDIRMWTSIGPQGPFSLS